jgi:hypothetical protein
VKKLKFIIIALLCILFLKSDVVGQSQEKIEQDIKVRIESVNFDGRLAIFVFDDNEDPYYVSYLFNTLNKYFETNNTNIEIFLSITEVDKFKIIFNNSIVYFDKKQIVDYFTLKKSDQKKFLQQYN